MDEILGIFKKVFWMVVKVISKGDMKSLKVTQMWKEMT